MQASQETNLSNLVMERPSTTTLQKKKNSDDQLKAITEEKHEDLQNTDRKSLILENNENNKNSRQ